MDWNPLNSSLFTGAGTPWGTVDTRPEWYTSINWDPRYSETFREVILPGAEMLAIGAATILTGGVAGVALGAGLVYGSEKLDTALGIEQHTFFGQYAPLAGALGGSIASSLGVSLTAPATAVPEWISGNAALGSTGGLSSTVASTVATAKTYAPLVGATAAAVGAAADKPTTPKTTGPASATPPTVYYAQAAPDPSKKVLMAGGLILLALMLSKK